MKGVVVDTTNLFSGFETPGRKAIKSPKCIFVKMSKDMPEPEKKEVEKKEVPPAENPEKPEEKPEEEAPEKTPAEIAAESGEGEGEGEGESKPTPKVVPESAFLKEKEGRKKAEKDLAALKKSIEDGASPTEVSGDIDAIAEKFGVDKEFLNSFAKTIRKDALKEVEDTMTSKQKAEQKKKDIDAAFEKHFKIAMDKMPEFSEIVNPEVIKTLSLQPGNANKTFSQIIEETYGKSLTGKRTIEPTKPGGGKDAAPLDFDKARKDSEYFKEVMGNPALKKEYNAEMLKRGV